MVRAESNLNFYTKEAKKCKVKEIKVPCRYCKGRMKIKVRGAMQNCFACKDGTTKDYDVHKW